MIAIAPIDTAGLTSELAALLLQNETNQAESARLQRDAAREGYLAQADQQVAALDAAASASQSGAFLGAALSVAGGACQIGAAGFRFEAAVGASNGSCLTKIASDTRSATILADIGNTSSELAGPLKTIIGDSTAQHYQAEAKRHETLAAQAQWQASDASTEIDKADKRADKALDTVQEIQRDQNAANNAVIGRI